MTNTTRSLALTLAAFAVAFGLSAVSAGAQSVTAPSTQVLVPLPAVSDWATKTFQDPLDMSQYTDLAWWTWANDAPVGNLASGATLGPCTTIGSTTDPASSCFKATTATADGNIWILESGNSQAAPVGRNGDNFTIDATTFRVVAIRMRQSTPANSCPVSGLPPFGVNCSIYFLWNQTSLYDTLPLTRTNDVLSYDGWGIYLLNIPGVGYAGTPQKTWATTIRDLRLNLTKIAGTNIEIDWIRLVPQTTVGAQQTISWSGFSGAVDIYLDNDSVPGNGNLGVIVQNPTPVGDEVTTVARSYGVAASPYKFPAAALAPGNYYVEICPTGTASPATDPACKYSPGSFLVNDVPTLTFTSPSPEGGADYATTVLGNPWDMDSLADISLSVNVTGATTVVPLAMVDEAGTSLSSSPVLQGTGTIGDPQLYMAGPATNTIDSAKYHILTVEAGLQNLARDIAGGSVVRMIWQVQGELTPDGKFPLSNVSDDIILNSRAGANVAAKLTLDMKTLPRDPAPGGSPSTSGWIGRIQNLRFDPDEFSNHDQAFFLRRIKLAANEQPTSDVYTIRWTYGNDTLYSPTPRVDLYYDTDTDPTTNLVQIATGLSPSAGSYAWNTAAVPSGSYYIYALVSDGATSNASYSRWPILVGTPSTPVATPTAVHMGATKSGTALAFSSPAQPVTVTFSGTPVAWTATANQTWVQVTGGSGTGNGRFTVSAVNPLDVIGSQTSLSASVTVTTQAGASVIVPVNLVVKAPGASAAPFGAFDTPASSVSPLAGSFGVTGWALDDIGIDHVAIYRDLAPGETAAVQGNGKILIASTAYFVYGARTDIETNPAYSSLPFASRAGWGYLLLSWGLFNQGNGPFTLYAYATDVEGHEVLLGSKSIVSDNAHATKPFGAIDTPAYGATVSAAIDGFGWGLTPNVNGAPSCAIGPNNVQVGIDSLPLTPVTYGLFRSDIAAGFPGFSNSNAAIGTYVLDPASLANGTHQIGWLLTDGCGRSDGVGSRFFDVLNGAAPAALTATAAAVAPITAPTVDGDPVSVQRPNQSVRLTYPNADGTRIVGVGLGERIEVQLSPMDNATYTGGQVVNGVPRALPIGSSLDVSKGIFYWEPGPGFLGTFDLDFVATRSNEQRTTSVRVVVGPSMRMAIDAPQAGSVVRQPFLVGGWAADVTAADGSGVDTVHVWAYPVDGRAPVFLGAAAVGGTREDVGVLYGKQFQDAAFNLNAGGLAPGTYDLVVYPHRVETNTFDTPQVVRVTVR